MVPKNNVAVPTIASIRPALRFNPENTKKYLNIIYTGTFSIAPLISAATSPGDEEYTLGTQK